MINWLKIIIIYNEHGIEYNYKNVIKKNKKNILRCKKKH